VKSVLQRLWTSPTVNTWAAFLARSLNLLLVSALVLPRFSEEETALWQMFASLIQLQLLADFGFNPTMVRLVAYAMGGAETIEGTGSGRPPAGLEPNWELLKRLAANMRWLYSRLAWGLVVLFAVAGTLALLRRFDALAHPSLKTLAHSGVHTSVLHAWVAWGYIIFTTWVSFSSNSFAAFLQGTNHVALVRRWESIFGLGSIVSSAIAIWLTKSLLGVVVANQIWFILAAFRNRWLASQVLDGRFADFPEPAHHPDIMKTAWPAAWRSGLGSLAYGTFQIADLVVGQHRDSSVVASYLMVRRLANTINSASQAPFYSRIPVYARLWAQHKKDELVVMVRRNMAFSLWAFVLPFALGVWLIPWGMKLIHSRTAFAGPQIWMAMGVALWFERYGAMHLQLFSVSHKVVSHIAQIGTAAIFAILAAVGYPWLGVIALPLAMWVGNAGFFAGYARMNSGRLFGLPFPGFDLATALPPLIFLLAAGGLAIALR